MTIINQDKITDFSVTAKGNFMITTKKGDKAIIKSTPSVISFLKLLLRHSPDPPKVTTYNHQCEHCNEGFQEGHGMAIHDVKFCNSCRVDFKHFDYFRTAGLDDRQIYDLIETNL